MSAARQTIEIVLWFAFAWLYFLYLLAAPGARTEHIGIGGAMMALIGAAELCIILAVLGIWGLVTFTS